MKQKRIPGYPKLPPVGSCLGIPLSDGRFSHCRLVFEDEEYCLIEVLDAISDSLLSAEELLSAPKLFGPVVVSVPGAMRHCSWVLTGTIPTEPVPFGPFRVSDKAFFDSVPAMYSDWSLWYGKQDYKFVGYLTEEQAQLEFGVIWPPTVLAERIRTGHNPYALLR